MKRRILLAALACWPAAHLLASEENPRPRHKISAGQLHEALTARFPVRFGLGGLLELQVTAPRLLLLPSRNRLGAALQAQVGGGRLPPELGGELEVLFALRYEPRDRSLRAHQPEIHDVRWPGLPPESAQALQAVLPAIARQIGEVVLHRFSDRELALTDTMGFDPEEIQVVDDGLVIFFGRKPAR